MKKRVTSDLYHISHKQKNSSQRHAVMREQSLKSKDKQTRLQRLKEQCLCEHFDKERTVLAQVYTQASTPKTE